MVTAGPACATPTHTHTYLPDDGRAGLPPATLVCPVHGVPCHHDDDTDADYVHDDDPTIQHD